MSVKGPGRSRTTVNSETHSYLAAQLSSLESTAAYCPSSAKGLRQLMSYEALHIHACTLAEVEASASKDVDMTVQNKSQQWL